MNRQHITTIFLACVTFLAVALFASTLVHALWYAPDEEITVPPHVQKSLVATSSKPVRLLIPSIAIDAKIQEVGIGKSGAMAVPTNYSDVAWYKYGTVPGHLGSAVIDGHVDNGFALPGVFKHLSDIAIGDDVYVIDANEKKLHFVVTDVEAYPYTSVPSDLIFNAHGAARLNLITCEGSWVPGDKTYDHRLVVFTELQND